MSDYEVGYGRPPKHSRFQKGRSGNPKGRPKGASGIMATMKRELARSITVQEGDRKVRMTMEEALTKRILQLGSKGNIQALKMVVEMEAAYGQRPAHDSGSIAEPDGPDRTDDAILQHFAALLAQGHPLPGSSATAKDGPDQERDDDHA